MSDSWRFFSCTGLNYAPTGVAAAPMPPEAPPPPAPDDETRNALREGRARLKDNNGAAALVQFKARLYKRLAVALKPCPQPRMLAWLTPVPARLLSTPFLRRKR